MSDIHTHCRADKTVLRNKLHAKKQNCSLDAFTFGLQVQAMERSSPPSARSAAPLVAAERGLAT
jgi:hypothetical protein